MCFVRVWTCVHVACGMLLGSVSGALCIFLYLCIQESCRKVDCQDSSLRAIVPLLRSGVCVMFVSAALFIYRTPKLLIRDIPKHDVNTT